MPRWKIIVLQDDEEIEHYECDEYLAILTEEDFLAKHREKRMIGKLHIVGMAGKFVEIVSRVLENNGSPTWWWTWVRLQAGILMRMAEYVEKTWGIIPTKVSSKEYKKIIDNLFKGDLP